MKHYLTFADFDRDTYLYLFDRTQFIKAQWKANKPYLPLANKVLTMIFEKPSTRTRISFEAGMAQLGGTAIYLNSRDTQLGRGETVEDAARVISRMTDMVMIRTFGQDIVERFSQYSRVPVINGLTNEHHPCQIMADIFTYIERHGSIEGKTVAWIGDSNNVSNSWIEAAKVFNFKFNMSCPPEYAPPKSDWKGSHHEVFETPEAAVNGADIVYTDVWTSMGYEEENQKRLAAFKQWQVNASLMSKARADALFMHCLPAHRGEEVTEEVLESAQSAVWDEAENRMHTEKALMEYLMIGKV